MKKTLVALLALTIALSSIFACSVFADGEVNVTVNGETVVFDTAPVIISGRTMIPARAVFEKMGACVLWDEYENGGYVSVITPDESVVLFAAAGGGDNYMVKDNFKKIGLDSPAVIKDGRTLVPLRAIGEAFGAGVSWDDETRTAAITFEPVEAGLSEATAVENESVKLEDAEKEILAANDKAEITAMPMYKEGKKFYRGISAEAQKEITYGADKKATESEYKIYGMINGKIIPYKEYVYYLNALKQNSVFGGEELTDESMKAQAESELYFLRVAAAKAEAEGVEFDKEFYDTANDFARMWTYGVPEKDYCQITGIDYETFNNFVEMFALRNDLITKLTEDGSIDVSDEAQEKILADKFLKAKHILFMAKDDNQQTLDEKALADKKKLAEDTLAKIKKGEDFDKLMNELSEDPGSQSKPDGYVFTDGEMVPEFENAVKALKPGEVSDLVETVYGYHIIKRVELVPSEEKETLSAYSSTFVNDILVDYMRAHIDEWKSGMEIKVY